MHCRVKSGRALRRNKFHETMNLLVRYQHALRTNQTRSARRQIKHIALAKQTIGSVFIENDPTVDLGGHLECDSARDIRFDYAGDHVRARSLCSDNQMNTRGTL